MIVVQCDGPKCDNEHRDAYGDPPPLWLKLDRDRLATVFGDPISTLFFCGERCLRAWANRRA